MTTLNLTAVSAKPIERAAKHAEQVKSHEADAAERARLEALKSQATARTGKARDAVRRTMSDPSALARTSADVLETLKRELISAEDAEAGATAALVAHVRAAGDLGARARGLSLEAGLLEQERFRAEHAAIVRRKLPALLSLIAIENEEDRLLSAAIARFPEDQVLPNETLERGAGLIPTTFPAGIFKKSSPVGAHVEKAVAIDDVLKSIVIAFPEFKSLLPEHLAAEISAKIATDTSRGVWSMAGANAWPIVQTFGASARQILRGRVRRDLRLL